jgi:hypothetical protein
VLLPVEESCSVVCEKLRNLNWNSTSRTLSRAKLASCRATDLFSIRDDPFAHRVTFLNLRADASHMNEFLN